MLSDAERKPGRQSREVKLNKQENGRHNISEVAAAPGRRGMPARSGGSSDYDLIRREIFGENPASFADTD